MEPDAFVQLVGSGNSATVESEWMTLVESDITTPELAKYHVVLAELCQHHRTSQAEALAWAAIEAIIGRESPKAALQVAGPFLLAIGESEELRGQVSGLYQTAYGDVENLEGLLAESGLRKGRPVRRAVRTMEVALNAKEGDYLVSRDEDAAARIDKIDRSTWEFTITHEGEEETLGVLHLADRFALAPANDFRVLRFFFPDQLQQRISSDPASLVIDLCRANGNRLESGKLEALLVPNLLSESEWKKWFSRARSALKESSNVKVEGRSPYVISYHDAPPSAEATLLEELKSHRTASHQVEQIDRYLRDCRTRKQECSVEALTDAFGRLKEHAKAIKPASALDAGLLWLAARRVGEIIEQSGSATGSVEWFKHHPDPVVAFRAIEDDALLDLACSSFVEARTDRWQTEFLEMLPLLPLEMCDRAATKLIEAGKGSEDFEPVVQKILASPIHHFEALLWLWNGPAQADAIGCPTPLAILTRVLRTLDDCRRADHLPKDLVRRINLRARNVLALRRYDRFVQCLDTMDPAMAAALRVQLRRLDNLGRSMCDDMIRLLRDRFPSTEAPAAAVLPWMREDVLFVTERGLSKKQAEIEQHVNVKMKENARAIGRAAELGDLSENSEYKFALEERDLLRARLAQMNAEVAMARIISPKDVATDHIGIGSCVVLQRVDSSERLELTFVGPWEADASKLWYNYRAPFSLELMGKKLGDRVELNQTAATGLFEIVEIRNALVELETPTAV